MKKGFTLMELLAVVTIIGILALLVVPGLVKNYQKSIDKTMEISENQINDAVGLVAQDYCNNPINKDKMKLCLYNSSSGKGMFKKLDDTTYFVCLEDLRNDGRYDNELLYEGKQCRAFTIVNKNENNKFVNPKTYIFCGDANNYDYATDETYDVDDIYTRCGYTYE